MPIYEFQCQQCEHELEVLQKLSDKPIEDCPECGEKAMKKKISAVGFRLKGGGWYETDFKTGNKKNLASNSSESSSDSNSASTKSGAKDSGAPASSAN